MKRKRYEDYTKEEFETLAYAERDALEKDYKIRKISKIVIITIFILFAIITLFNSITTVPTGYVGIKTRFGQVQNTVIHEGLNFKLPFIEKIVKLDCRTQKAEYIMEASSKDLQKISNFIIAVNYNVNGDTANTLYKEVGTNYQTVIIEPSIKEAMKSIVANYTAEELITKRSEVSTMATEAIYNKLNDGRINVTSVNILDLSFSPEFDAAIEAKQIAEQKAQQAQYELEKAKIENETKIENAKAESEVMKLQNQQITEQTLKLKELENQAKMIEKWNGQLPTTVTDEIMSILNQ